VKPAFEPRLEAGFSQIDTRGADRYGADRLPRLMPGGAMVRTTRSAAKAQNRRGSPEAIEKRKAARLFNDILGGRGAGSHKRDGRTEKRRQRLMRELESGKVRGSRELKPLDVLVRVHELMELGEPLRSIRKVAKVRKTPVPADEMVDVVSRLHKAYGFRPECYRFVGVGEDVLRSAGVLGAEPAKRGRARKRSA
jgi:hypothetical protein